MTNDEIARETAEALLRVGEHAPYPRAPGETYPWLFVDGRPVGEITPCIDESGQMEASLRGGIAAAVLVAIDRALRGPIPPGLPEREHARILGVHMALDDAVKTGVWSPLSDQVRAVRDALAGVIDDNNHLRALLRDCAEDGLLGRRAELIERGRGEGFRQGFAAGAKEQHRRDVQYANAEAAASAFDTAAIDVAYAVHEAPLAEPAEGV